MEPLIELKNVSKRFFDRVRKFLRDANTYIGLTAAQDMTGLIDPNVADSGFRYYEELVHKFHDHIRTIAYCISFVFLALHLLHGFNSAFQSIGANNKYTKGINSFSKLYAVGIPLGFIFIALFHHLNH